MEIQLLRAKADLLEKYKEELSQRFSERMMGVKDKAERFERRRLRRRERLNTGLTEENQGK